MQLTCAMVPLGAAAPHWMIQPLQQRPLGIRAGLQQQGRRSAGVLTARAERGEGTNTNTEEYRRESASLRAEVEAPFRIFRLGLYGAGLLGAGLASLFCIPTVIGALAGAASAKPALEVAGDVGINFGSLALFAWLFQGDYKAREVQIERLTREEALGACRLELANGKLLRLAQLRGFARVVLCAGTTPQVLACLEAAEPYKADLIDRGVLVVGLPIYDASSNEADALPALAKEDLKWRAVPIRLDDWRDWFARQVQLSSKTGEKGLYISMRKDGRVRGSGSGCPPWERLAAQLPPSDGFFGGLFDGMDGKV